MTRWVRSGSSQKHKRMPGNATKWGEFDNQYARKILPKRKKNIKYETDLKQKLQLPSSNFPSSKTKESLDEDFFDESPNIILLSTNNEDNSNNVLINKTQNPKKKKNKKQKSFSIKYSSLDEKTDEVDLSESEVSKKYKWNNLENDCSITNPNEMPEQGSDCNDFDENRISPEDTFFNQQNEKERRKKMKKNYKIDLESLSANGKTVKTSFNNSDGLQDLKKVVGFSNELSEPNKSFLTINQSSKKQKMNSDSNQSSLNNNDCKNSSSKVFEDKTERHLKRLQKKREKLGLLPPNVKNKLRKILKRLKEKGFPPEKQKEIMREARRKVELKYGKVFNPSKLLNIKYSSLDEKTDKADPSESEVSKRFKQRNLENHCSSTNPNEVPEQGSDCNDFDENRISPVNAFLNQQNKKERKKKMKKNCNKIDSESANGEITKTSFDNSDELLDLEKVIRFSNELSEPNKSFQEINQSSEKQKMKKCDKMNSDSDQSSLNNNNYKNSSSKVLENRKEKHLRRLQKKREKLGLLLLPRNVENKLRKIHKRLKEKGFPPEKQKEIMREARRKEELKYRKVFNPSKLCFGCREAGHVLADCPKKSESLKQETGICFKCGSVEHTSLKCPEKVQGFPYAKCFICKEQGHISRECPKNKHGVYPKGGRCKLCGNVNHLKKDCPTLKKKENEEETITLHTLSENASIDAEVVKKEEIEKKSSKKAKIVKF